MPLFNLFLIRASSVKTTSTGDQDLFTQILIPHFEQRMRVGNKIQSRNHQVKLRATFLPLAPFP